MSEAEWGSEVEQLAAPPKKRIPGWVWGCGAGCLLFALVAVLALVVVFRFVSKALDQDVQWERLAEVLPVEEPPPGVHIFGMPFLEGTSMWVMTDTARNVQAVLIQSPPGGDAGETRRELLDPEGQVRLGGPFGGYGRNEVEPGQLQVQGRTLPCLRYQAFPEADAQDTPSMGPFGAQLEGASIVVDLAVEGSDELLVLILTKMRTSQRVTDQEITDFLAPFQLPGGVAPPAAPPAVPPPDESGGDGR